MPHKSSLVCTCFWVTTTTTRRVIFKHSTFISADWWNIIIPFLSFDVSRYYYIDSRSKNILVRVWMSEIYTYGKKIKVFIIISFLFCGLHKLRKLYNFLYLYYYCDHVAEISLHFCDAKILDPLIDFATKNICS